MKVSVDRRRLKARQMLIEASYAKSQLIKALKDDDLKTAFKAFQELSASQGYPSNPAQELGITDAEYKELSKALGGSNPGGNLPIRGDTLNLDQARKILGVGKSDKPQQKSRQINAKMPGRDLEERIHAITTRILGGGGVLTSDEYSYDDLQKLYGKVKDEIKTYNSEYKLAGEKLLKQLEDVIPDKDNY